MNGKRPALVAVVVAALLTVGATAGAAPLAAGNVRVVKTVQTGGFPDGVAVDAATNRVYVADEATESLEVINATTGKLLTRIRVGLFPYLVAVDPTRDHVFVVDYTDGRRSPVVEINGRTNKIIGSVLVGSYPEAVEIDPVTGGLLVTAAEDYEGAVYLIKTAGRTPKLVRSFGVPEFEGDEVEADQLALDAQTNTFYVVGDTSPGKLWKINASTFATSTYTVGNFPLDPLAVGTTLWIETDSSGDVLDQLSASDPSVSTGAAVPLPGYGFSIARDSATHTIYVVYADTVYAVRSGTETTIDAGTSYSEFVVFDQRDGDLFLVNEGPERPNATYAGNVTVVRGLTLTQTVPTGNYSAFAALNPASGKLYVVNSDGATMSILQAPVG